MPSKNHTGVALCRGCSLLSVYKSKAGVMASFYCGNILDPSKNGYRLYGCIMPKTLFYLLLITKTQN